MYAAHLDGYIYRYYADDLNQKYDEMALAHHIDSTAIAYRDNKAGSPISSLHEKSLILSQRIHIAISV